MEYSRRDVLKGAAAAALAAPLLADVAPARAQKAGADRWRGLKIGVATYTFRTLPLDGAIKGTQRVGLKYASVKDMHLPLKSTAEERKAVAQKFADAGITLLSCGVIYMKNDEAAIRQAFEYARDLGVPTIVAGPDPDALDLVDKMIKEFGIRIAIHNHGPGDRLYPTPEDAWNAVKPHDPRMGLCIDVGHTARAGVDPAEAIVKYRERLYDVHMKDVSALQKSGGTVECGRGAINLKSTMQALVKIQFPGHVGFEYEKDGNDPLPGLAESVGYTKGLLEDVKA